MTKKYELTDNVITLNNGTVVKQIKALINIGDDVEAGDLGGYVESEDNLSHEGLAWVYDAAVVFDNAKVSGDARIYDNAQVFDDVCIFDEAWVSGNACVYNSAEVFGDAHVYNEAQVCGRAKVCGKAHVYGKAKVFDDARVYDDAKVFGDAEVNDYTVVKNSESICGKLVDTDDSIDTDSTVLETFIAGASDMLSAHARLMLIRQQCCETVGLTSTAEVVARFAADEAELLKTLKAVEESAQRLMEVVVK